MPAPVAVFNSPDWKKNPGAELAMNSAATEEEFKEQHGLAYDEAQARWVSPRLRALREKTISVADLDDEELVRGQVRDSDGRFRRGPARKIPREFHDELMRRILDRGTDKLRMNYLAAIDLLVDDVINDTTVDIALRVSTAKYVIERLGGKTPDRVEATVSIKPWEKVMNAIVREIPVEIIEEAQIVEDDVDE